LNQSSGLLVKKIIPLVRNALMQFPKQHDRLTSAMRTTLATSNTTLSATQFSLSVFVERRAYRVDCWRFLLAHSVTAASLRCWVYLAAAFVLRLPRGFHCGNTASYVLGGVPSEQGRTYTAKGCPGFPEAFTVGIRRPTCWFSPANMGSSSTEPRAENSQEKIVSLACLALPRRAAPCLAAPCRAAPCKITIPEVVSRVKLNLAALILPAAPSTVGLHVWSQTP